jgi:hypothetical protein
MGVLHVPLFITNRLVWKGNMCYSVVFEGERRGRRGLVDEALVGIVLMHISFARKRASYGECFLAPGLRGHSK